LRCLARAPLTEAWCPDLALSGRGVVAVGGQRVRERILKAAEQIAARSPRLIEIRGL
jgi:citrate lyase beta subunit